MSETGIDEFAKRLVVARANADFVTAQPARHHPRDLQQAYDIQEAVHAIRAGSVVAYKVGLTNLPAQRAMDAVEPIVGRLAACDLRRSPATIRVSSHLRIVEAEFVFEMGRDLLPSSGPYAASDIVESISAVYAGVEICNSRFGPEDVSLACLVADNSNADLLVIGEKLDGLRPTDLVGMPVTLTRQRKPPVPGSSSNVLGDPLASMMWLANWLAARGEFLKCGQFVASGSCTGMTELDLDELAVARFGNCGQAAVKFV